MPPSSYAGTALAFDGRTNDRRMESAGRESVRPKKVKKRSRAYSDRPSIGGPQGRIYEPDEPIVMPHIEVRLYPSKVCMLNPFPSYSLCTSCRWTNMHLAVE